MSNATLDLGFFRRSGSVPIIRQNEAAECGLACLAMVANYYNYRTTLPELRRQFAVSLKGTTLARLGQSAQALGLQARPLRLEVNEIPRLRVPCILHWNMDHFVVLERAGARHVVIVDPARGREKVANPEIGKYFSGVALELIPTHGFRREPKIPTKRLRLRDFFSQVAGIKSSFIQLLLFSLALQVFTLLAPLYSQIVIDQAVLSSDHDLLNVVAWGFGFLAVLTALIGAVRSWVITYLSSSLNFCWLTNLFHHLLRLPVDYFEKRHLGDIQSRFGSIHAIQELITTRAVEAVVDGSMVLMTIAVMAMYNVKLAVVVILSLVLYVAVRVASLVQALHASQDILVAEASKDSFLLESMRGILPIKIYCQEDQRGAAWQNKLIEAVNARVRLSRLDIFNGGFNSLIFSVQNVLVIWLGARLIFEGHFSVGMLVAFLAYSTQFTQRASALVDTLMQYRLSRVHLERVADIVDTDKEDAYQEIKWNADVPEMCATRLAVDGLSFRYAGDEPYIFQDVSFEIRRGEHIAICGPSGCGKTTLIKVMMGLLAPSEGQVLVDGRSLNRFGVRTYRAIVGSVMQEDELFAGTIADNISLFQSDADRRDIELAARLAAIDEEIEAMPMGYYSLVGDMGSALSGGQKQRILLARALFRRPAFLFLDEATSHLDLKKEREIGNAIAGMNATRVTVAHRPETLKMADRLIRLDERSPNGYALQELRSAK